MVVAVSSTPGSEASHGETLTGAVTVVVVDIGCELLAYFSCVAKLARPRGLHPGSTVFIIFVLFSCCCASGLSLGVAL